MKRPHSLWLLPGLTLATGVALVLGSETPDNRRLLDMAMACISVLLFWGVAFSVYQRYAQRSLWLLLLAAATTAAVQLFAASSNAWLYTLARAARPAVEVLLIWMMLAFPTGRLRAWQDKALVAAAALAVLLLWVPGMMFSPRIPLSGPFVTCGADCPANLLFVADKPQWAETFFLLFRLVGGGVLLATSLHLLLRLHKATRLMRRTLAPVLLASMARTINLSVFVLTGGAFSALTVTLWAIPLAIGFGLLRGRLYAARCLQRLVSGLRHRPGMDELRTVMAEALEDPSLELGYWHAAERKWLDSAHRELSIPQPGQPGRASTVLHDAKHQPVAVLIHDEALLEEPLLLDAVVSSMHNAIVGNQVELALVGERIHAVEQERQRIERDLHDGSQQRLLALRMKISVAKRLLENDPRRAAELMTEMGADVDDIVIHLREVSHGIVPAVLVEQGLGAALAELARQAGVPVTLDLREVGRCDAAVENAVYYCCAEALQNVVKHAGELPTALLTLRREGVDLVFSVEDDGPGVVNPSVLASGHGMANMKERMLAVGGRLDVLAIAGLSVKITGTVPQAFGGKAG